MMRKLLGLGLTLCLALPCAGCSMSEASRASGSSPSGPSGTGNTSSGGSLGSGAGGNDQCGRRRRDPIDVPPEQEWRLRSWPGGDGQVRIQRQP